MSTPITDYDEDVTQAINLGNAQTIPDGLPLATVLPFPAAKAVESFDSVIGPMRPHRRRRRIRPTWTGVVLAFGAGWLGGLAQLVISAWF